ncbi:MAG TPA: M50 family metallopeptidase [Actinomycetota bacterium]|nr:M50 family metallopeptidase [Actinomycetota bacterium]
MSTTLGVVLFIVVLILVVVVHEAGHFLSAKLFGIKVEEFFVGFGPRLWSFRRGETEYGLKAIPAGGYVRIAGMNPFQEPTPEEYPRTFGAKPIWQRAIVILAGPVTHFVIAALFLTLFFVAIGVPNDNRPMIGTIEPTLNGRVSPAVEAGLRPGDEIVAVDGRSIRSSDDFIDYTRGHIGEPMKVTVVRDGRSITLTATPVAARVPGEPKPVGRLGVSLDFVRERTDPFTAVGRSVIVTGQQTKEVVVRLGDVFGPTALRRVGRLVVGSGDRTPNDAIGVVGASRIAGQAVREGAWDFFIALLVGFNIFVAILNLVPLPPLDGGHLAILAYEKVRRRKPDIRKLVPLTALVTSFIILFALAITYLDIVNPIPTPFR